MDVGDWSGVTMAGEGHNLGGFGHCEYVKSACGFVLSVGLAGYVVELLDVVNL